MARMYWDSAKVKVVVTRSNIVPENLNESARLLLLHHLATEVHDCAENISLPE
jgi:hypothetical protein